MKMHDQHSERNFGHQMIRNAKGITQPVEFEELSVRKDECRVQRRTVRPVNRAS